MDDATNVASDTSKIPSTVVFKVITIVLMFGVLVAVAVCVLVTYMSTTPRPIANQYEIQSITRWQVGPSGSGKCIQVEGKNITGYLTEAECMRTEFPPRGFAMSVDADGWPTGRCEQQPFGANAPFKTTEACEASFDPESTRFTVQCVTGRGCIPTAGDAGPGKVYTTTKNQCLQGDCGGCKTECKTRWACDPGSKTCRSEITGDSRTFKYSSSESCSRECQPQANEKFYWNPAASRCQVSTSAFLRSGNTCAEANTAYDTFNQCMTASCAAGCFSPEDKAFCSQAGYCAKDSSRCCGNNVCGPCDVCRNGQCVSTCGTGEAGCTRCDINTGKCDMRASRPVTALQCENQCICRVRRRVRQPDGSFTEVVENVTRSKMYNETGSDTLERKPEYRDAEILSCSGSVPLKEEFCAPIATELCRQYQQVSVNPTFKSLCDVYRFHKRRVDADPTLQQSVATIAQVKARVVQILNEECAARNAELKAGEKPCEPVTVQTVDMNKICPDINELEDRFAAAFDGAKPQQICQPDGTYKYRPSDFASYQVHAYNSKGANFAEQYRCSQRFPSDWLSAGCATNHDMRKGVKPWCTTCHAQV